MFLLGLPVILKPPHQDSGFRLDMQLHFARLLFLTSLSIHSQDVIVGFSFAPSPKSRQCNGRTRKLLSPGAAALPNLPQNRHLVSLESEVTALSANRTFLRLGTCLSELLGLHWNWNETRPGALCGLRYFSFRRSSNNAWSCALRTLLRVLHGRRDFRGSLRAENDTLQLQLQNL